MRIWKIVSGILSIVLCLVVLFQSCAAGLFNVLSNNGDTSGSAGLLVAILMLVGGIVAIATRDAIGNGGNVAIIIIYGLAALVGYVLAGSYGDLIFWATWCLICAIVAALAIAADNICSAWVYVVIIVLGIIFAAGGTALNTGSKPRDTKSDAPSSHSSQPAQNNDVHSDDNKPEEADGKMIGEGDLGDYHVEIKGAELDQDYDGESIIVITYAWTNNSDETKSAMFATSEKAFQDGIELESSFFAMKTNFSNNDKDVRPGNTLDIKKAFVLTSDTSTVEFEITEWISFSDDMVTMDFDPANLS